MQQESFVLRAPAKINLSLRVVGRRGDGYHLLSTRMQKVGLYDELTFHPARVGIELHCSGADLPQDAGNLVYRAAELFLAGNRERLPLETRGVVIRLTKKIPVAAGLGGGSSDAAATLLGLNRLYQLESSPAALAAMGVRLGADVPFFLDPSPAVLATGIGELLHPVPPLTDCWILLVNPGFSVSTHWVYQNFALTESDTSGSLQDFEDEIARTDAGGLFGSAVNDLERVTLKQFPDLQRIKAGMLAQGADMSLMSGSGPTVFGVFTEQQKALAAHAWFRRQYPCTFLVDPVKET
jgi:4-diphosphocytidyl-2-C-methyl-D-erythritol kinase